MTDKELLEKAARACGLDGKYHPGMESFALPRGTVFDDVKYWNPLTNSGDCAEMNAALRIGTIWHDEYINAWPPSGEIKLPRAYFKDHNNDPLAAWRYASTVVAGMMGERE